MDIFACQMIVFLENLLNAPTAPEKIDDELDGNSRSLNDGLAQQHVRINDDSLLPVQYFVSPQTFPGSVADFRKGEWLVACELSYTRSM